MKAIEDLWPDDLVNVENPLPKEILIEQANYLRIKTKNVLIGEVKTTFRTTERGKDNTIVHEFIIKVPSMGNYQFVLLKVMHGFAIYPLTVWNELDETEEIVFDEHRFKGVLAQILRSELVKNAIGSLVGRMIE